MKYEITKGSEKDFDGVPGWALYVETYRGNVFASEGYSAGDRYIALTGLDKVIEFIVDDETNPPGRIIAERRPITEPVWDGEGLPPVGVECDWLDNRGIYIPVKVVYSSEFALVIQGKSWLDEKVDIPLDPIMNSDKCKFRPIRSPEDVARDAAVAAMINHKDDFIQPQTYYHAIYDAIAAGKIPGVRLE